MDYKKFFWVLTILIGFIFQITLAHFISIYGTFPNLLLLGTVFFAVRSGSVLGEWTGFVWGFLSDVMSTSIFGSQTFMLTLLGYSAGRLQGKIDDEKPVAQMSLVLFVSLVYLLGLVFFELFFGGSVQIFKVKTSFLQPIYSTLMAPLIFSFLKRWDFLFHKTGGY